LFLLQEFAKKKDLSWKLYKQTSSAGSNTETTETTSHVYGAYLNIE